MVPRSIRAPGASLRILRASILFAAFAVLATGVPRDAAAAGLALSSSFAGAADDGGGVPPDVQGAAGPDHLLVMLNTTFVAQRKSDGAVVKRWAPAGFWAAVSGGDLLFDPRVAYDALAGRWIAAIATEGATGPPAVLLALSDGPDPTLGWTFRKLDVGGGNYAEFPLIGYTGRWIVATSNLVSGTTGYLAGSAIWVIGKTGPPAAATRFTLDSPGSPIAPAATLDAEETDAFLVQELSGNDLGHGRARLFRVTEQGGAAVLSAPKIVTAPATWSALPSPIESLPQAGSTRRLVSDQDEFASACVRNGRLWAVQTATVPATAAAPVHTAVQWWRLSRDGALEGFGRIEDPSGTTWLGFPSIAVNADDQALIGYSLFSGGAFASAGYSIRSGCGGDAALSAIHILKPGEAPYERLDGGGHNRWGDLSQTVVDPDGLRLWTFQEYAAAPDAGASRWGTWWGGFSPSYGRAGACVAAAAPRAPAKVGAGGGRGSE